MLVAPDTQHKGEYQISFFLKSSGHPAVFEEKAESSRDGPVLLNCRNDMVSCPSIPLTEGEMAVPKVGFKLFFSDFSNSFLFSDIHFYSLLI